MGMNWQLLELTLSHFVPLKVFFLITMVFGLFANYFNTLVEFLHSVSI